MKAVIQTKQIEKSFHLGGETIQILKEVNISITEGEMVAILGPSGSGKSTLMNILGCLDRPSSGQFLIDGKDVSRMSSNQLAGIRNKKIGFIFQSFHLLPRLSALKNVELPLLYGGVPKARKKAQQKLEEVGLGDRMHHLPSQLSGGQRQRVAIARALVTEPLLLLADEPTGNLDSNTGRDILAMFQAMHGQGKTLVIVTHDPSVAAQCARQIVMLDGKVVRDTKEDPAEDSCPS